MPKHLYRHISASLALLLASSAYAQSPSFSLNGTAGLIDMPTAQLLPDGETAWTFTATGTVYGGTLAFQMLPNLETAVHFMTVDEWAGGVLYDQSLDLKYQIFAETDSLPSLAIGSRDFLSNGAFSSEYIVASKEISNGLTVTGGLGWGRLGSQNPIATIGTRPTPSGTDIDFNHFFQGDVALFGGLEWDTPIKGLSVKAEYSSDAYIDVQNYGSFAPESPLNFGIDYEPIRGVSVGGYYNYGTDFGLRLTLSGNPNRPIVSPDLGIGPVPVNPRLGEYDRSEDWANNPMLTEFLVGALAPVLEAEGIVIEEALITGNTIDLYISNNAMPQTTKAIGRIVRTLSVALPHSVEIFRITPVASGLATTTVEIRRTDLEAQVDRPNAGPDSWATTRFLDASNRLPDGAWSRDIYPDFSWALSPIIPVNLASNGSAASID
ncbi:MAG: YjbH domain-containing protein, partial [Amylibacter sp.]